MALRVAAAIVTTACAGENATPGADTAENRVPVVIVGAGAAGLAAASQLPGALVLEGQPELGGQAAQPGPRQFLFVGSPEQEAAGVSDSVERALADWATVTGAEPTDTTRAFLAANADVRQRLVDVGLGFQLDVVTPIHQVPRRLHLADTEGAEMMTRLADTLDGVEIRFETWVTALRIEAGRVRGVETADGTIDADVVIVASGGFLGSAELVTPHVRWPAGSWSIADPLLGRGDALRFAQESDLGTADLGAMGAFVLNVAIPDERGMAVPLATSLEPPWIFVDAQGRRFVDETRLDSLALAGAVEGREPVWGLTTREQFLTFVAEAHRARVEAGIECASDWEALAAAIGVSASGVATTLADMEAYRTGAAPDRYFRFGPSFPTFEGEPCAFVPGRSLAKAYGGLQVTETGQVVDAVGAPIEGLYAVGEAAGMGSPGMGGLWGFDGSLSAVMWSGWRTGAAIAAN